MSRLSRLLASVAERPESLNREAYEEIARDHLHDVIQLAAEWETERCDELRELRSEADDLARHLHAAENERDAAIEERNEANAKLDEAQDRIRELEQRISKTEARAS